VVGGCGVAGEIDAATYRPIRSDSSADRMVGRDSDLLGTGRLSAMTNPLLTADNLTYR